MLNVLAVILLTFLKFNYFSVNKVIFGTTYFINQGDSYFIEWISLFQVFLVTVTIFYM